jgi:hypothetical protein
LAEKTVEQAKQAFDGFIANAHKAINALEGQAESARRRGKSLKRQ